MAHLKQVAGIQEAQPASVQVADAVTFNKEKMATHSVSFIGSKQLSDGQLALLAECCGDPSTHSWLTCHAEIVVDDQQYQDSINYHVNRVANLHESMNQALAKAQATIGTTVSVTPSASLPPAVDPQLLSVVPTVTPTVH